MTSRLLPCRPAHNNDRACPQPRRMLFRSVVTTIAVGALVAATTPASAAPSLARDAEAEALIKDYLRPIFKVAGIRAQNMQVFLVNDQSFNAFVANGQKIFVNVGAILNSETPGELIGVLAHETAHVANGDLARFKQQMDSTKTAAILAALAGMGAMVAGAVGGVGGLSQAGAGVAMGTSHVAQRSLLAYRRSQESEADRSAVAYLDKAGLSGAGMLKTFEHLADQSLFLSRNVNPYLLSHPLPRERLQALEEIVKRSPNYGKKDSAELLRRHRMVQAKLAGFTWTPDRVSRKYGRTDNSPEARYARAISALQNGPLSPALRQIDALVQGSPSNPYYWELKGQALLENGRPAEAIAPLRKAVSLAPKSGLILNLLGQALVATERPGNLDEAIKILTLALQQEPDMPVGYRSLARAYALKGDLPMADLATAQGYFADGKVPDAKRHATRAQAKLKPNSPAWLRADDIVTYKAPRLR